MPILIGLALILSTFISTVPVQKIAYAQARTQPSSNGAHVANSVTQASTVVGRNTAVQALPSVQTTSAQHPIVKIVTAIKYVEGAAIAAIVKFKQNKDNCQMGMGPCICQIHPGLC